MTKRSLITLIILVIVALLLGQIIKMQDKESVVCTQEALVCPDGSGVGRSGPQCTFVACTATPSFTGELKQQDGKFFLVVGSGNQTGEVAYSLPLELKISNVVGQLLNQQVTVHGAFSEGNTYVVESIEEVEASSANTAEVGIGETKFVNGVRITLHSIVADNRCPVDVQCIEAGAITANVTLKSNTDTETFNMPSDEVPHAFDSYKVSIEGVKPSRIAAQAPDPKSYKVTFKVVANPAPATTFTGTISAYSTQCFVDGICSVTVGSKKVITTIGWKQGPVGTLKGVESIGDLETKIGHKATVYAARTPEGDYTLYGSTAYYVDIK